MNGGTGMAPLIVLSTTTTVGSAAFLQGCERNSIRPWQISSGSPWQNAKTEIEGGQWKRAYLKVMAEVCPQSKEEWETCIVQTNVARGQVIREGGWSPDQLRFGRNPRMPGSLLNIDERDVPIQSRIESGDKLLERSMAIRSAARKAV